MRHGQSPRTNSRPNGLKPFGKIPTPAQPATTAPQPTREGAQVGEGGCNVRKFKGNTNCTGDREGSRPLHMGSKDRVRRATGNRLAARGRTMRLFMSVYD